MKPLTWYREGHLNGQLAYKRLAVNYWWTSLCSYHRTLVAIHRPWRNERLHWNAGLKPWTHPIACVLQPAPLSSALSRGKILKIGTGNSRCSRYDVAGNLPYRCLQGAPITGTWIPSTHQAGPCLRFCGGASGIWNKPANSVFTTLISWPYQNSVKVETYKCQPKKSRTDSSLDNVGYQLHETRSNILHLPTHHQSVRTTSK